MLGGIEAGGTKFICAVSDDNLNIIEKVSIPTTSPAETFEKVFRFFDKFGLKSIGIGSFGPIDINKDSVNYGYITSTPKKAWRNTDFLGEIKNRYSIPIGWDTDVNVATLGEYILGAGEGKRTSVYLTVGTGIGGGIVYNGQLLNDYVHPEMGHIYTPRYNNESYSGVCDYHQWCLEGLASGPAIEKRYGIKASKLPNDHDAWVMEAHYLAHAVLTYTMILRPDCIILGGGVMNQRHLYPMIREKFREIMNDYLPLPPLEEYIVPPKLGKDSGIIGSLLLAKLQL